MDYLFGGYKATCPEVNPKDRFVAFKEAEMLLKTRKVGLKHLFNLLFKSENGFAEFSFGDVMLQFTRGFGVWSERKDVVQVTLRFRKKMEETPSAMSTHGMMSCDFLGIL